MRDESDTGMHLFMEPDHTPSAPSMHPATALSQRALPGIELFIDLDKVAAGTYRPIDPRGKPRRPG